MSDIGFSKMMFWQIGCFGLALLSGALGFTGISASGFGVFDPSIAQGLFYAFFAMFLATLALDLLSNRVRHRTVRPVSRPAGRPTNQRR